MITVKVGEPRTKNVGDIWFDPTTRITSKAILLNSIHIPSPFIDWMPLAGSLISVPPHPTKGLVWIDPITSIPQVWDGNSWILAVPASYPFPPFSPSDGTVWTEPMTMIQYICFGGQWNIMSIHGTALPPGAYAPIPSGPAHNGSGNWVPTPLPTVAPPAQQNLNLLPTTHNFSVAAPSNSNILSIHGPNNTLLVAINAANGTVTYGPNYTPDAAAEVFWTALGYSSPKLLLSQYDEILKDLKDVSHRLGVAEANLLKFKEAGYTLPEPPKPFDPMASWEKAMGIIQ